MRSAPFCPRTLRPLLAPLLGSLLLLPVAATAGDFGLAVKASTLGFGVEGDYVISDKFSVRVQANRYDYDSTFDEDDIEYDGKLELSSYGALLDWHPFGSGFRVSVGGYSNDNKLNGTASGEGTYNIGDESYTVTASDDLRLTTDVELGSGFAPYVGVGWGHAPSTKGGLLLSFDVGVLFQGSPSVDLRANGTANNGTINFATDPTVQAELLKEENNLEDDLEEFDLYPVVSAGIGYRF